MNIKCPKCSTENTADSQFCKSCAAPLPSSKEISVTETLEAAKEQLTTGSLFAGRYQIIEELGKGGMGKVYRALDKKLDEEVAIKLIKPEVASDKKTLERFSNELKLARKISHKNVGRMYELMEEKGTRYITMEYVPGEDLKRLIRKVGQFSAGKAVSIAKQVCEGLAEAHQLGVVHRDLKPQNVMVDEEGNARILDFGIARTIKGKGITGAGVMVGTPEYMSPEQAEVKDVDQRSDIYSLGVILYEMVTGRIPFEGETPLGIAMKHKSEMPKDPRELNAQLPKDLSRVILTCMEKDKEKRYQSAGELRAQLANIEKGIPSTEIEIPKRKPTTSKEVTVTLQRRWLFIIIPIVILLLAAMAVILLKPTKEVPQQENKMIVVLPFENLGLPEDEYFADGITDEITNRLSALHGLDVISRASAAQYKKTQKTITQIREELNVDYALAGTVRWDKSREDKGRVRITPQLIRTSDSAQVWSDTYERSIEDIFAVQSDIAEEVIKQLDLTLLEPERAALRAKPTDNLDAYNFYLKGRELYSKAFSHMDSEEFEHAIQMWERAGDLDPEFALAYVRLSLTHSWVYFSGFDRTPERLAKSKAAVDKALQLQPDMPEALSALAFYYYRGFLDYERALEILLRVQKARPNYSPALIGYIQRRQGNMEQSLETIEKAFKLNPRSSGRAHEQAGTYMALRRYDEALIWLNRSLSIVPDRLDAKIKKTAILLYIKGNTKEGRVIMEALPEHFMTDRIRFNYFMAERDYEEALSLLNSLSYESQETQLYYFQKDLAYASVYHAVNNPSLRKSHAERALNFFENAVREHPEDPRIYAALGLAYAYLGRNEEAVREGNRAAEIIPVSKDALVGPIYIYFLARIYTIIGEHEKAIDNWKLLLSMPSELFHFDYYLPPQLDPLWDPLRRYPRFKRLIEEQK